MGKKKDKKKTLEILRSARGKAREEYLAALKDNRKQRSNSFKPKKGKGSYKRKEKYQ